MVVAAPTVPPVTAGTAGRPCETCPPPKAVMMRRTATLVALAVLTVACSSSPADNDQRTATDPTAAAASQPSDGERDLGDQRRLERLCERIAESADTSSTLIDQAEAAARAGEDPAEIFADLSHVTAVALTEPPEDLRQPVADVLEFIDLHLPAAMVWEAAVAQQLEPPDADIPQEAFIRFERGAALIDDACGP